ncbi:MAG: type II toxin-antitoxin system RelE/ParE family toxin [Akkermansiaceae bacterium]|jgi:toxin ParE1/3/4|nr:type II toxin-antitoxin system RelE/ParE family toxin [Akkermansiaceae bacterium]MDP4647586.1 type II toxin-antitoxin system RelE/ParE family toxin [Akkermansiaceae bacterium]MDP4720745.1 type II toxin-antitoxin system RelE/ParE family toxin [Akkermansiaceae bacterium]MDP4779148.1 type II toxin-antitoxin system RelE/ParE family toxin [Akkermansiaceae bacterium]MDP4847227.1 type II toxin-antitoxin system RelE/ParE family toxin [Akkermansiaceae bacterium]
MARLIWTEPALQDLEQLADYISLDDDSAARRLVKKVFEQAELLESFPEMCPHPHDLPDTAYRHLVVNPLRIFYRIENDIVYIVYAMRHERLLRLADIEARDGAHPPR